MVGSTSENIPAAARSAHAQDAPPVRATLHTQGASACGRGEGGAVERAERLGGSSSDGAGAGGALAAARGARCRARRAPAGGPSRAARDRGRDRRGGRRCGRDRGRGGPDGRGRGVQETRGGERGGRPDGGRAPTARRRSATPRPMAVDAELGPCRGGRRGGRGRARRQLPALGRRRVASGARGGRWRRAEPAERPLPRGAGHRLGGRGAPGGRGGGHPHAPRGGP